MPTVAHVLGRCLRTAGVRRVFGQAIAGAPSVAVLDDSLAALLADAAGHVGPAPGAAFLSDRRLRVSSRPGGRAVPVAVTDPVDLVDAVVRACAVAAGPVPATAELTLELDLRARAAAGSGGRMASPAGSGGHKQSPAGSGGHKQNRMAGPGPRGRWPCSRAPASSVPGISTGSAPSRRRPASAWPTRGARRGCSPGTAPTTWAPAGSRPTTSPCWASATSTCSSSPASTRTRRPKPGGRWRRTPSPHPSISPRSRAWAGVAVAGPTNRLYPQLAAVVQRLSPSAQVPLSPARAVADLRAALPPGGVITADPGLAGLWIARTFPTTDARSIGVPATVAPGYAAAAALVARLDGRPAIAVTTAPVDAMTARVLDLAAVLGVGFPLELWAGEGRLTSADDHCVDVRTALDQMGVTRLTVPVDATHTDELVAVAGDVVAWGGLSRSAPT